MAAHPQTHNSASNSAETLSEQQYANAVNPDWIRLLKLLQMNVRYERCLGVELFTANGRRILDLLSGYCVHNLGHNHPAIIDAIKDELARRGCAMLQSHVPEHSGELAERLCSLAGGIVKKAFFCSSGSEGIEAAIKFARAHTKRAGIFGAEGAFHGLTCGALSLMGNPLWKEGFAPLLSAWNLPIESGTYLIRSEARGAARTGVRSAAGASTERESRLRADRNHALVEPISKLQRFANRVADASTGPRC